MTNKMMMNSGYERRSDDDYRTIDKRCIYGLIDCIPGVPVGMRIVDVCSPNGSGIVDTLNELGHNAICWNDAFASCLPEDTRWIISNPPYTRPLVDKIIYRQIERIEDGQIWVVAMLTRTAFDHAKTRAPMFSECPYYSGQVKLRFRPRWVEKREGEKEHTPFHNFVWHLWGNRVGDSAPFVLYSNGEQAC
jgi:hypothetical protein